MNDLSHMTEEERAAHTGFIALLPPVKEWLAAGAKHQTNSGFGFNMDFEYKEYRPDYNRIYCGTAMCIGGAITQFNPEQGFGLGDLGGIRSRFFEIDNQIGHLFYPDVSIPWDRITPTMALQAIDNFEKTGNARWYTIEYDGKDLNPTEENDY